MWPFSPDRTDTGMIVRGHDMERAESHGRRAPTMNMADPRLSRTLVNAATVSLVVSVAQWLPVSANGGDPLIDTLGGVRSTLDKHGVSLGLQSTDEVFGNPNGGRAQGATFDGQTALGLGIDLSVPPLRWRLASPPRPPAGGPPTSRVHYRARSHPFRLRTARRRAVPRRYRGL
jgi:hypothetical protein